MTVRIYHNTDVSAPALGNTAGSMITLLDAVLVNGYGSQSPLGWTKAFSGTNVAVYRNDPSAPGSTGMYLKVTDTNAGYSIVRAYKTMSDINTGTDVTPSTLGVSYYQTDIYWFKHYSNTASPKRWSIIGDERTFYMNINTTGAYPSDEPQYNTLAGAGDFDSLVPSNSWNYMVFGNGNTSGTNTGFPDVGTSNAYTMYLGRAADLYVDRPTRAYTLCTNTNMPGSPTHNAVSPYTGMRHYADAIIAEDRVFSAPTGFLRGCKYHVGRSSTNWFQNMGKLPSDPSGPDLRELFRFTSSVVGSILVKESDW